ncbi:MAG: hypothetical protein IJ830_00345 [Alphaproteobacteria bacterium]|nr:hypothetical protein [Alphaproteobacteria bacterium]
MSEMYKYDKYKEDMIIYEEDQKILDEFYEAAKNNDANKAKERIDTIKELPFLTYKDVFLSLEKGYIHGYYSRPWKARALNKPELAITEKNEEMHPFLADFFDFAVHENMTRIDGMLDEFKQQMAEGYTSCVFDGNYEICIWLDKYAETAVLFEAQGKKIIEPKTFKKYPCLKQCFERKKDGLTQKKIRDLAYQASQLKRENKKELADGNMQAIANILLKNLENPNYFRYMEILDEVPTVKEEVCEKSLVLKFRYKEEQKERLQAKLDRERETSVNVNEDLKSLTDEQRKQNFDQKKKLMEEHLIMTEACLNSMCTSYYLTEDKEVKDEMLSNLYDIRKGGEHNKDKRDMAKTFQRVLDRNPGLKKDENLVALSKIDTPFSQPTKRVQKQVTR